MSTIDNLSLYQSLGLTPASEETKDQGELGLHQFLQLMTTQLSNQDPLEPMENGDFLGQIAQFGTVSGIEQLNTSFASFSDSITSGQALEASSLLGKQVLAPISVGYLEAGGSIRGRVGLEASASNVKVEISDQNGELVRTINMGTQTSGPLEFTWDGLDEDENFAQPGVYNVRVEAVRGGVGEELPTLIYSKVDSVNLATGVNGLTLNLNGLGSLPLSEVATIL